VRFNCRKRVMRLLVGKLGGPDQDFRRYAADIHAGAADDTRFDDRDRCTLLNGFQRGCKGGRPASDNHDLQRRLALDAWRHTFAIELSALPFRTNRLYYGVRCIASIGGNTCVALCIRDRHILHARYLD
jgi:hypothetical protein